MDPIYAAPGDTGRLRYGHEDDLAPVKVTVAPECKSQQGRWVCIAHAEIFMNNITKDGHVGNPHAERCRLAWLCPDHGVESA